MSIPYVPQGTSKRFKVPRTLAADFTAFLNQDIPNAVMDFELVPDWVARETDSEYEKTYIRGEIYPDSTKSRYENTDNNMNFRADVNSGIKKGDMLIEPDNTIYILDWAVHLESNDAPSRAVRCNMYLTITRWKNAPVDEDGYLVDDLGYVVHMDKPEKENSGENKVIVDRLPANAYRYDGRPEYVAVAGTPGTIAGALTLLTVQFNEQTKLVQIGDKFDWGGDTYEIVDIDKVGLNIDGEYGTLKLQAKRAAGGLHGYE